MKEKMEEKMEEKMAVGKWYVYSYGSHIVDLIIILIDLYCVGGEFYITINLRFKGWSDVNE